MQDVRDRSEEQGDVVEILVVDDHALMRAGLECLLDATPGLHVAGTASSGPDALQLARELSPDVVLMDVSLPGMDGVEATRLMHGLRPRPAVVMLTSSCSAVLVRAAFDAGAVGFLLKDLAPDRLLAALRGLEDGHPAIDPRVARILRRERRSGDGAPVSPAAAASSSVD